MTDIIFLISMHSLHKTVENGGRPSAGDSFPPPPPPHPPSPPTSNPVGQNFGAKCFYIQNPILPHSAFKLTRCTTSTFLTFKNFVSINGPVVTPPPVPLNIHRILSLNK